jgi:hypothetical protein
MAARSSGLPLFGWLRRRLPRWAARRLHKKDAALGCGIVGDLENGAAGPGVGSGSKSAATVSLRRARGYSAGRHAGIERNAASAISSSPAGHRVERAVWRDGRAEARSHRAHRMSSALQCAVRSRLLTVSAADHAICRFLGVPGRQLLSLLKYEFENQILAELGYSLRWR